MTRIPCFIVAIAAFCTLAFTGDRAFAAGFDRDLRSFCTETWCDSPRIISGTFRSNPGRLPAYDKNTWTYQVLCAVGDCCRIGTENNQKDPMMTVVGPTGGLIGDVWFDDDSGNGTNALIKIDPVPTTGAYTIIVSDFGLSFGGIGQADFEVWYKRYDSGNPNCSFPTTPYDAQDAAGSSADKAIPDPNPVE